MVSIDKSKGIRDVLKLMCLLACRLYRMYLLYQQYIAMENIL